MANDNFDFGAMLDAQLKGVKRSYKFGNSFDHNKSIVRPEKKPVEVDSDDNIALKRAWNEGAAVSGIVEKEIKGGYEVTVAGERAFCPFSQIDRMRKDAAEYIGRKFDFIITEYSRDDRGLNIIVSRRELMEIEAAALKEAVLNELTEGETLNGTVTRVLDFGAFVDLGGLEGLVSAREISWERVDNPASVLKSGDMVTVKVLRIDREEGKVSLSRKECLPRVFRRSDEEIAEAKSAEEVAQWMAENEKRNRGFGSLSGAFGSLGV